MSKGLVKEYDPVKAVRRRPRKCAHCGSKLSTYNENKYCFAHMWQGYKSEIQKEADRRHKHYQAQMKYAEKQRKLRRQDES